MEEHGLEGVKTFLRRKDEVVRVRKDVMAFFTIKSAVSSLPYQPLLLANPSS